VQNTRGKTKRGQPDQQEVECYLINCHSFHQHSKDVVAMLAIQHDPFQLVENNENLSGTNTCQFEILHYQNTSGLFHLYCQSMLGADSSTATHNNIVMEHLYTFMSCRDILLFFNFMVYSKVSNFIN
jgi:hypothetical protein